MQNEILVYQYNIGIYQLNINAYETTD